MKKILKRVVGVIVVLLIVVVVAVSFFLNDIVKQSVERIGPKVTTTTVTLDNVSISLLSGKVSLEGLEVGNPEGFKTPHAMRVGALKVAMQPSSFLSRQMVVKEIVINAPEVTYEMGLKGSNIGRLQAAMEGSGAADTKKQKEPEKQGKTVLIERLVVTGGKIRLSTGVMQGKTVMLPLPDIELHDIGKQKGSSGGATIPEVTASVLKAIFGAATAVVTDSGRLLGDGAKKAGEAALSGAEMLGEGAMATGEAAKKSVETVGDGAKAVGESALKGVESVGGAAVGGAKAAGNAAKKGVSSVAGGVKKLLGGKDEED